MGIAPSVNQYSGRDDTPIRVDPQEWKLIEPFFGKPYWKWVGTGPAKPCGSLYTFKVPEYNGPYTVGTKPIERFEGPKCPGWQAGGGKKRKPSKKTRKASRR